MSWDADFFRATLVAGLVVVGACIALLMDYLKSYNEQLRERNIDLSARQQERDRWLGNSPEAFVEKIAPMLKSALGLAGSAPPAVSGASVRARHRAATYGQAAATQPPVPEPVSQDEAPAHEFVEEDAAAEMAPVANGLIEEPAERRPRNRARREAARVENWVSKEELEKLAERAARIRARYGSMTGDEPAEAVPVEGLVSEAAVPEASEAAELPEPATTEAHDLASQTPEPVEAPLSAEAQVDQMPPEPIEIVAAAAEPVSESTVIQQEPQAIPECVTEEVAPVWDIPASPAQMRISAAVASRELAEAPSASPISAALPQAVPPQQNVALNVTPLLSKALAAVPSYETAQAQQPSAAALQHHAIQPFETFETGNATGADNDLDALFDQTYGSPSWLAMNGQEAGAALDSVLPTGLFEGGEFGKLMSEAPPFTGVAVSIRINDFASVKPKLSSVEGVEAMSALSNLIRSLLREDRDFAGRSQEDEYVLLFPGDTGDEGQRRLFHLSERLWDFQLRSLGGLALMLSWGGLEIDGQPVPEAVSAARDRLEESRRGRAKPGSTFRSARRAS